MAVTKRDSTLFLYEFGDHNPCWKEIVAVFQSHKILTWWHHQLFFYVVQNESSPLDVSDVQMWWPYVSCKWKYQPWIFVDLNSLPWVLHISALSSPYTHCLENSHHIGQSFKIPSIIFIVFDKGYVKFFDQNRQQKIYPIYSLYWASDIETINWSRNYLFSFDQFSSTFYSQTELGTSAEEKVGMAVCFYREGVEVGWGRWQRKVILNSRSHRGSCIQDAVKLVEWFRNFSFLKVCYLCSQGILNFLWYWNLHELNITLVY